MNKVKKKSTFNDLYLLEVIHDKWIDVENRQIWIHGVDTDPFYTEGSEPGVEYMMATKVIKNLYVLLRYNPKAPIIVNLHTCGGDLVEGLAIYDAIKLMPYEVTMISYTHARSMSSIILQAADKRLMLPHSYFMFHGGEQQASGTVKQVKSYVEFSKIAERQILDIYGDRLQDKGKFKGKTKEYIRNQLKEHMDKKEEVYLTAEEAVEWGFADGILKKF
jgi:ATP-dependent Clp protease protease subunit